MSVDNERADAGRDGRTCLARPNSTARTGTGKNYFPCSADHEQDWQPYWLILHLLCVMTIHAYCREPDDIGPEILNSWTKFVRLYFITPTIIYILRIYIYILLLVFKEKKHLDILSIR